MTSRRALAGFTKPWAVISSAGHLLATMAASPLVSAVSKMPDAPARSRSATSARVHVAYSRARSCMRRKVADARLPLGAADPWRRGARWRGRSIDLELSLTSPSGRPETSPPDAELEAWAITFGMDDNRAESCDSRTFASVPTRNLIGRPSRSFGRNGSRLYDRGHGVEPRDRRPRCEVLPSGPCRGLGRNGVEGEHEAHGACPQGRGSLVEGGDLLAGSRGSRGGATRVRACHRAQAQQRGRSCRTGAPRTHRCLCCRSPLLE